MRRLFGWMAGVVSIAALARLLSRRRHEEAPAAPSPDPADELKAKLASSREAEPGPPDAVLDEPASAEEAPPSIDERRRRVHDQAQQAIDEMGGPEP